MSSESHNPQDLQSLMDDLICWSKSVFGACPPEHPSAGLPSLHHLREEIDELIESPADTSEWADVFILVLDAAARRGFTAADLMGFARAKLAVNQAREWGPPDANGVRHHVRVEAAR